MKVTASGKFQDRTEVNRLNRVAAGVGAAAAAQLHRNGTRAVHFFKRPVKLAAYGLPAPQASLSLRRCISVVPLGA